MRRLWLARTTWSEMPRDDPLGAFPGDGVAQGMATQGFEDEDVEPQAAQLRPEPSLDQGAPSAR